MKTTLIAPTAALKTLTFILCVSVNLAVSQIGTASVFTNSVSVFAQNMGAPSNQPSFVIEAFAQPNSTGNGGYVWVTINFSPVLSPYNYTVGIGEKWFSVDYGTVFDPAALSTATPFANNLAAPFTPGHIPLSLGQDFYLGFVLEEGFSNTFRYGWAHLKLTNPTTLTLLGNAIEDSGSGIIVGTMTVVPEPSTFSLAALSLGLLARFFRRRS
jgi:hypothetical protein